MQDEIRTNTILNGRYEVQRVLGRGGMGAVYLAWDTRHRRQVAVKLTRLGDPEARAQFRREAGYLQRLSHHSLPRVWDLFSDTQRDFLVMEYIPGDNLEELVRRDGRQPEWLALRWADELLDVLTYLHGQDPPIIHRDIKPNNLKLRQDETLVLVDFGIAKEYLPDVHTQTGAIAVSPGYSPLEQYSNRAITDARSDLYSLGATLYFLLTGVTPPSAPDRASGDKALAPIRQIAPDIQPATQMLVQRAVQIHRDERWASAVDMHSAVTDAASLLAAQNPRATAATKKAPRRTRKAKAVRPSKPEAAQRSSSGAAKWLAIGAVALALIVSLVGLADSLGVITLQSGSQALPVVRVPPSATLAPAAPAATSTPAPPPATATAVDTPTRAPATATPVIRTPIVAGALDETATVDPDIPPTSTRVVFDTPTPPAAAPAATPTSGARSALGPATRPPATSPAASADLRVTLLSPDDNSASAGVVTFRWWLEGGSLGPNQAMELVMWQSGRDPLTAALGLAEPVRQPSVELPVNLPGISWLAPGQWQWGVLLVETAPYRRIRLLSDNRGFNFERSGQDEPPRGPVQWPAPGPLPPDEP